jgi:hypothetical protein
MPWIARVRAGDRDQRHVVDQAYPEYRCAGHGGDPAGQARPGVGQVGQRQDEDYSQQGAGAFQPGSGQHGVMMAGCVAGQRRQRRGDRWRGRQQAGRGAERGCPPSRPRRPAASTALGRSAGRLRARPASALAARRQWSQFLLMSRYLLLQGIARAGITAAIHGLRPGGGGDRLRSDKQRQDPAHALGGRGMVMARDVRPRRALRSPHTAPAAAPASR